MKLQIKITPQVMKDMYDKEGYILFNEKPFAFGNVAIASRLTGKKEFKTIIGSKELKDGLEYRFLIDAEKHFSSKSNELKIVIGKFIHFEPFLYEKDHQYKLILRKEKGLRKVFGNKYFIGLT